MAHEGKKIFLRRYLQRAFVTSLWRGRLYPIKLVEPTWKALAGVVAYNFPA